MTLNEYSQVEEAVNEAVYIPETKFNLVPIDELGPYTTQKELIDVIDVVQSVSPTMSIRRKIDNQTIPKRDIVIADNTSVYYGATDVFILRFMIEACWAPMLGAFSVPIDQSDDVKVIGQCLEGFRHAIHVTAAMSMKTHRDAFVTSLEKFSSLHSPSDIKKRNIDAIKEHCLQRLQNRLDIAYDSSIPGHHVRFIIMGNLFCSNYTIHRRFDLKGSSPGRLTDKPESEIEATTILKDLDLKFFFRLQKTRIQEFRRQIVRDCDFLEQERIMDYSLLVGLNFREPSNIIPIGDL